MAFDRQIDFHISILEIDGFISLARKEVAYSYGV